MRSPEPASAGHKIGQMIGDWWEQYVIQPLLLDAADELDLFLDCRFVDRPARESKKILWQDGEGNSVDYDFVLEIGGTPDVRGVPVGFIESFWRRGARHSKDKARDDTNKLLPMRSTYPTARFLSIAACGEFTQPAAEYVKTREVNLFFINKKSVIGAFSKTGIIIDYADDLPEIEKAKVAAALVSQYTDTKAKEIAAALREECGAAMLEGYTKSVLAALSALPHTIEIIRAKISEPMTFSDTGSASKYLNSPEDVAYTDKEKFKYSVRYSDGSSFETDFLPLNQTQQIHKMTCEFVDHISKSKTSKSA